LTGELFEVKNEELKVTSLDGHRISIRKISLKENLKKKSNCSRKNTFRNSKFFQEK
jgi:DNA polymerase III sliding clamp (beta) subunit (PCNA family)